MDDFLLFSFTDLFLFLFFSFLYSSLPRPHSPFFVGALLPYPEAVGMLRAQAGGPLRAACVSLDASSWLLLLVASRSPFLSHVTHARGPDMSLLSCDVPSFVIPSHDHSTLHAWEFPRLLSVV